MASSDGDIGRLTESQQLALHTYTSVTDQEPSAAIPLLERSQWNVQVVPLAAHESYEATWMEY